MGFNPSREDRKVDTQAVGCVLEDTTMEGFEVIFRNDKGSVYLYICIYALTLYY
jgi:hypothetical protein